jgi:flagellar L-ring protein precursor FlgH
MKSLVSVTILVLATTLGGVVQTADGQEVSRRLRASWLTDRKVIPIGAIVTVVVDERTTARERTSRVADADRSTSMGLSAGSPDVTLPISSADFGASNNASSRNLGEANRRGDLSSIFTVSVVGVDPSGNLMIEGTRTVEIDGRTQEWELSGLIRPDDVSADNIVPSSRIASAEIHYKGQNIGPSRGIISKILGIFWP